MHTSLLPDRRFGVERVRRDFFAHTCSVLARPVPEHRNPYLERKSFPQPNVHSQSCAVERLAGPFYLPEYRTLQLW